MKKIFLFIVVLTLHFPQCIHAETADSLIKKVVENLNGRTAVMQITMEVSSRRAKRSMKIISYSVGQKKSFIKILYPGKDAGITFLKVDNSMWQYVPRIKKVIKMPASSRVSIA